MRRGRLVWRLVAIGLAQLALVVLAAVVLPPYFRRMLADGPEATGPNMREPRAPLPPGPRGGPPPEADGWHPPPGPPPAMVTGSRGHHRPHRGPPPHVWLMPLMIGVWGALIVGVGMMWTGRGLLRPLHQITRGAEALGQGDLRARVGLVRNDEIGELANAFDQMAARVERLVLGEKELLANVSHELRTPLARIRVAVELAAEGDGAAAKRALAEISTDLDELSELLEQIFALRRLEMANGKAAEPGMPLRREAHQLAPFVAEVAERFRVHAPSRPLKVDAPVTCEATFDRGLLGRAVANLLQNAHRYSPEAAAPIELAVRCVDGMVELAVRDHGVGLAAADAARIFEPFYRVERSRDRAAAGLGLGLTLVQRIAVAHGGSVAVVSEPGQGATFTLRVPQRG